MNAARDAAPRVRERGLPCGLRGPLRAIIALIGVIGAASGPVLARAAGPMPLSPARVDSIDRLVKRFMVAQRVPGLSMAIVLDGRLAWSKGYGFADLENRVAASDSTMFRCASMGKTMTATAAMQLVEAGRLDTTADMRTYCAAFPSKRWVITPLQLLEHTSGIRHYGGPHDDDEQYSTIHYASVSAALAPFKDDTLAFQPGTRWLYSTYGYDVLGCVIEGASGMPLLDYMRSHVWQPAGMMLTRDDDPRAIVPRRASGYAMAGGRVQRARMADMSNRMAAGCYLTTVDDLAKFIVAVLDHRLVSAATFQRMIAPTRVPEGEQPSYGMGWGVETEPWHDDWYVFHGGSSPGVSGALTVMPRHRFAVVFITNLEDIPGQARGDLAEDVTRLVLGFGPRRP
jgi:CubicO group peptidase (beta-lactamase class C family)